MATAEIQTVTADDTIDPKDWLRAASGAQAIGVDRENEVIRGVIIAQEGPFKSEGRGEFDLDALTVIADKVNASPNGLKSRLAHPDESNDGVGKFLGRVRNANLDEIGTREAEGELKTDRIAVVRADLHIDPSSHTAPSGDLGRYVMDLAESDPDAMSTSLVLQAEKTWRLDEQDRPLRDDDGNEIPPLWQPTHLHALDLVDTGDAVDGMLTAGIDVDALPNGVVYRAQQLMAKQFAGKDREFVRAHCEAWLDRCLNRLYGEVEPLTHIGLDLANGSDYSPGPPYDPDIDPATLQRRAEVEENRRAIDAITQRGE
jgi:hypothetical protein